ncbi:MAG: hypothetical protein HYV15_04830 [Elusimicrobia bacterium]|nr:hypothetical protein [Elusimicrobiota bacterium]
MVLTIAGWHSDEMLDPLFREAGLSAATVAALELETERYPHVREAWEKGLIPEEAVYRNRKGPAAFQYRIVVAANEVPGPVAGLRPEPAAAPEPQPPAGGSAPLTTGLEEGPARPLHEEEAALLAAVEKRLGWEPTKEEWLKAYIEFLPRSAAIQAYARARNHGFAGRMEEALTALLNHAADWTALRNGERARYLAQTIAHPFGLDKPFGWIVLINAADPRLAKTSSTPVMELFFELLEKLEPVMGMPAGADGEHLAAVDGVLQRLAELKKDLALDEEKVKEFRRYLLEQPNLEAINCACAAIKHFLDEIGYPREYDYRLVALLVAAEMLQAGAHDLVNGRLYFRLVEGRPQVSVPASVIEGVLRDYFGQPVVTVKVEVPGDGCAGGRVLLREGSSGRMVSPLRGGQGQRRDHRGQRNEGAGRPERDPGPLESAAGGGPQADRDCAGGSGDEQGDPGFELHGDEFRLRPGEPGLRLRRRGRLAGRRGAADGEGASTGSARTDGTDPGHPEPPSTPLRAGFGSAVHPELVEGERPAQDRIVEG